MSELVGRARVLLYDVRSLRIRRPAEACAACGGRWPLLELRVITPMLAHAWELDDGMRSLFDAREGSLCVRCQSSARSRHLAQALIDLARREWRTQSNSLADLVLEERFAALDIAEVNSCGALHQVLKRLPNLAYSEFGSTVPTVPSEDLMGLSYRDNSFDLVITSDTLEHVPEPATAVAEIARILRPGGWHVFTVPIVPDGRPTRRRAQLDEEALVHGLPPSYHGRPGQTDPDLLVFHEFGLDFIDMLAPAGFSTTIVTDPANATLITLLSRKAESVELGG